MNKKTPTTKTTKKVVPKRTPKVEEVAPKPTSKLELRNYGSKKVTFLSNGANPKLGKNGTEKPISERNAVLFAHNGWGEIVK